MVSNVKHMDESCHTLGVYCSVLQRVAVCGSVLQCVAVCCSALQRIAVCCSLLQRVAVRCSMQQRGVHIHKCQLATKLTIPKP